MATGTLVDSNVLLDVFNQDAVWFGWSSQALASAVDRGPVLINPIIYAEVAANFSTIEELDSTLPTSDFLRSPLPWNAAFLAGRAHRDYRRRGGPRTTALPDFYIGAHAALAGLRLLTRDPRRYRTYFPRLELQSPDVEAEGPGSQ